MLALIDGDPLLYASCFATEYNVWTHPTLGTFRRQRELENHVKLMFDDDELVDWKSCLTSEKIIEPISHTYRAIDTSITNIIRKTGATDYRIYLKDRGDTFRDRLEYPVKYKGGRQEKPSNFNEAKQYLAGLNNVVLVSGIEVDDALGINQDKTGNTTVICTIDKDLDMIPGLHWDMKNEGMIYHISVVQGEQNFWKQMLTGDRVDNIIGIKGLGPVTADKLINHLRYESLMREVVEEKYKEHFGANWKKMFDANMVLLKILTEPLNGEENASIQKLP